MGLIFTGCVLSYLWSCHSEHNGNTWCWKTKTTKLSTCTCFLCLRFLHRNFRLFWFFFDYLHRLWCRLLCEMQEHNVSKYGQKKWKYCKYFVWFIHYIQDIFGLFLKAVSWGHLCGCFFVHPARSGLSREDQERPVDWSVGFLTNWGETEEKRWWLSTTGNFSLNKTNGSQLRVGCC